MLDAMSLDQLRTFIAAVDEGSFSAAGRRLKRAQSVVSQTLANLEGQLGIQLFDRSRRIPVLTEAGRALVPEARMVAASMDVFKARAHGLAGGLEPELSIVIDVMFPIAMLTRVVKAFQEQFPATALRLHADALGGVLQPIFSGECAFGIIGTIPTLPPQLTHERLLTVTMIPVAAPTHPLAAFKGPIPVSELSHHVQLVLTDRTSLTEGRQFGVISPKTWRLTDLGAKHAFLKAGLGWGGMPAHQIEADLASGALVRLDPDEDAPTGRHMAMSAVFPAEAPPGPAGRWFIERLKEERG